MFSVFVVNTWVINLVLYVLLGNLPRRHAAPVVLFLVVYYLFRVFLLMPRWKILSDSYSQNYRGSELHGSKYLLIWSVLFWASAILSDSYSQNYRGSELHGLKYLLIWSVLFLASAYLPFENWSLNQKSSQSYRRRIPIFFWVRILTNFISTF
jgi:hypothetical protein